MKKLLFLTTILCAGYVQAQKAATKPVAKKVTTAPVLKNLNDSASYAMGIAMATFYSSQGVKNINSALVAQAIRDVAAGKKTVITEPMSGEIIMKLMNKVQAEKARTTIKAGEDFLVKNKKRPEVKTTPSGLQYEIITNGSGPVPTSTDTVVVHYKGMLLDGTVLEDSKAARPGEDPNKQNDPITFPLNRVIPGWTEGLALMPAGSKYKFYIPYTLAYGINDNGPIPGGSLLIFEVELLEVKGK